MTPRIIAANTAGEVQALRPLLAAYFDIISNALASFGQAVDFAPMVADMMAHADQYLPPHGRTYYAVAGGDLVGMVFLKPLAADFELKRLYVRPDTQGTGLGRHLLERAMTDARDLGATAIYLDSLRALTRAVRMYERAGFDHIAPYPESEVAGHANVVPHAVFMRCTL